MPQCCRCNSGGKCRNCVCAKVKRHCTNCLPSKKGCCSNTVLMSAAPTLMPAVQGLPVSPLNDSPLVGDSSFAPAPPTNNHTSDNTVSSLLNGPHSPHILNSALPPPLPQLPTPTPLATPTFTWGSLDADAFMSSISCAYAEVVQWRLNSFTVPYIWKCRKKVRAGTK